MALIATLNYFETRLLWAKLPFWRRLFVVTICLKIKSGQFLVLVYCPCNKNKDFKLITRLPMHVLCFVTCRLHWWRYQVTQKPSQACCGWITTRCAVQAGITLFASGTFRLGSTNKLWCVYRLFTDLLFPRKTISNVPSITWRRVSNPLEAKAGCEETYFSLLPSPTAVKPPTPSPL